MSRLVLVRHGESLWNAERRVQGQSGSGLSERGVAQAQRTAELLAETYPEAVVAASDLQRTRETVAPLARLVAVEVRFHAGLRERHFGSWTGLLADEIVERDTERWNRWVAGHDVVGEVGGEDTPTFSRRVVGALRDLLPGIDDRPLICVTHGGPIWHGTHALLGTDRRLLAGVANCSVTELDLDPGSDGGGRLVTWNQVAHLPVALRSVPRVGRVRTPELQEEDAAPADD
ncbi:MAG TPA: histidine phosphatase family protein [Nitriliruptorales bacterium]|nr:histidine phosphatase family protein [Nitriliruptorales bacterium]